MEIKEYVVDPETINELYEKRGAQIWSIEDVPSPNQFAVLRNSADLKNTAFVRFVNSDFAVLVSKKVSFQGISPKDKYQEAVFDALSNDIPLTVLTGRPGSGKTTLALSYALTAYEKLKRKIVLTKPTVTVGREGAFGPVPGDIQEKYAPYLDSFYMVFNNLAGPKAKMYLDQMIKKEDLKFMPLQFTRGCTFKDCTLILDEAQNTTWHELKTLVSRLGENSKLLLLGDLKQIDIPLPMQKTGLFQLINSKSFENSHMTTYIDLKAQYRSPICDLVEDIHEEILGGSHTF